MAEPAWLGGCHAGSRGAHAHLSRRGWRPPHIVTNTRFGVLVSTRLPGHSATPIHPPGASSSLTGSLAPEELRGVQPPLGALQRVLEGEFGGTHHDAVGTQLRTEYSDGGVLTRQRVSQFFEDGVPIVLE
jgi:hypothetical protein